MSRSSAADRPEGGPSLLGALRALRDPSSGAQRAAVKTLSSYLEDLGRAGDGTHEERVDLRQDAMFRLWRALPTLEATTEGEARAFARRVYKNLVIDASRKRKSDALSRRPPPAITDELAPVPSDLPGPDELLAANRRDPAELERLRQALFDEIDEFLDETVARAPSRAARFRNAEIAWRVRFGGASQEDIRGELPEANRPSTETFYKWVQRGRDQVLVPALERLVERGSVDESEARFHVEALALLRGSQRGDAGKPRPERRRSRGSTGAANAASSVPPPSAGGGQGPGAP